MAAAQIISGFFGCTTILTICLASFKPIFFQVFPSSVDFHMPPKPSLTLPLMLFSPSPTYTIDSLVGAMAIAPIVPPKNPSEIFFQLLPASVVFQTPPPVAPI